MRRGTYQDLHREPRLAELDRVFVEELRRKTRSCGEADRPGVTARGLSIRSRCPDSSSRRRAPSRASSPACSESSGSGGNRRRAAPEAVLFRFRATSSSARAARATLAPEGFRPSPGRRRRSSGSSSASFRGRATRSSRPRGWDPSSSTWKPSTSRWSGRRSDPPSPTRPASAPRTSPGARPPPPAGFPLRRDDSDEAALEFLEALLGALRDAGARRLHRPELRR